MVARAKWTASKMIIIELPGVRCAAISTDQPSARYEPDEQLKFSHESSWRCSYKRPVQAIVEVQRGFGGIAPRALLGGHFVTNQTSNIDLTLNIINVHSWDEKEAGSCLSSLSKKPFISGLPREYASWVVEGIIEQEVSALPSGEFIISRAGYDVMESSGPAFRQCADLLRITVAALIDGRDVESEARDFMESWGSFAKMKAPRHFC